ANRVIDDDLTAEKVPFDVVSHPPELDWIGIRRAKRPAAVDFFKEHLGPRRNRGGLVVALHEQIVARWQRAKSEWDFGVTRPEAAGDRCHGFGEDFIDGRSELSAVFFGQALRAAGQGGRMD